MNNLSQEKLATEAHFHLLPKVSQNQGWEDSVRNLIIGVFPVKSNKIKSSFFQLVLELSNLYSTRLLCLWNSPGKNTGVGNHFLLQLCTRHDSKCFPRINIISVNPHDIPKGYVLLLPSLYRWGNWGNKRLSTFPKVPRWGVAELGLES